VREGVRPLTDVAGVRDVQQRGANVLVTVGSGDYEFTVSR